MTTKTKERDDVFAALVRQAEEAGYAAALAARPTTMVVGQAKGPFSNEIDYTKKVYFEPEGACGFAWVIVRPGTSAFAKYLKKVGKARPDSYYGGVCVWVSQFNQSVARKEAYAQAYASVLSNAGVNAYANSRLD